MKKAAIPPTPAPEVKEEKGFYCKAGDAESFGCRTQCEYCKIPFNAEPVKEGINLEKVQKGIDQLWESETPESLKEWHANHTVKDTPVEQKKTNQPIKSNNMATPTINKEYEKRKEEAKKLIAAGGCVSLMFWSYTDATRLCPDDYKEEMKYDFEGMVYISEWLEKAKRAAELINKGIALLEAKGTSTEQPANVPDTVNLYQVQQTCPHCGTEYFGVCSCSPGATTTTTGTHMVINLPNTETTSVSDPKGEIPVDIVNWIRVQWPELELPDNHNYIDVFYAASIGMYRKMQEHLRQATIIHEKTANALQAQIATLTKDRNEYASQTAISFYEWMNDQDCQQTPCGWVRKKEDYQKEYTTTELYTLYLETNINKQK